MTDAELQRIAKNLLERVKRGELDDMGCRSEIARMVKDGVLTKDDGERVWKMVQVDLPEGQGGW